MTHDDTFCSDSSPRTCRKEDAGHGLDVADTEAQHRLIARNDPRLHVIMFAHQGKRSALGIGIRAATAEVVVLTDSDTRWVPGLLAAVQMPFIDPMVGAVGTRQNVFEPNTSVWRRVADWIIDNRYLDYVPATGCAGAVVCVSGRTAAYRRSVVLKVLPHLEHEFFLGRRCVAGDDGRLTWLAPTPTPDSPTSHASDLAASCAATSDLIIASYTGLPGPSEVLDIAGPSRYGGSAYRSRTVRSCSSPVSPPWTVSVNWSKPAVIPGHWRSAQPPYGPAAGPLIVRG